MSAFIEVRRWIVRLLALAGIGCSSSALQPLEDLKVFGSVEEAMAGSGAEIGIARKGVSYTVKSCSDQKSYFVLGIAVSERKVGYLQPYSKYRLQGQPSCS